MIPMNPFLGVLKQDTAAVDRFNPDQFAQNFFSKVSRANRSVRDVFFLNTLFLWQQKRSADALHSIAGAAELIEHLNSVYEIEADASLESQFNDCQIVTLERIHFAFPFVACKVALVGADQRKPCSHLDRVMAVVECPAFGRYCSVLNVFGGKEGKLIVDAYLWGQVLAARRAGAEVCAQSIREKALRWKPLASLAELGDILGQKLGIFKDIGEMLKVEANVELGIAELRRSLQASLPNLTFVVDTAIHERLSVFSGFEEASDTFLSKYEVLYFSGGLLSYLTLIKRLLCRNEHRAFASQNNLPELRSVLKSAATSLLTAEPDEIVGLMSTAGLRTTWARLMHAAHERVRPITHRVCSLDVPDEMTRFNMAELGLGMLFTESTLFKGHYPNLIRKYAHEWRALESE